MAIATIGNGSNGNGAMVGLGGWGRGGARVASPSPSPCACVRHSVRVRVRRVRCAVCVCVRRACVCCVLRRAAARVCVYAAILCRAAGCWVCACFPDSRPGFAKFRTENRGHAPAHAPFAFRFSLPSHRNPLPSKSHKPRRAGFSERGIEGHRVVLWQCCGCGCEL
jgi:hypothetical protein